MVVGAQHVQAAVRPAQPLVQVVRAVGGEVGPVAVGLAQHPVLVVAEVGGAQPGGAVGLVHVALGVQPFQGGVQLALVVQLLLVEVHVEVHPECGQRRLDLVEHQPDALDPEHLLRVRAVQHVRVLGHDGTGDVGDVLTAVAALGDRFAARRRQQRPREPVDLPARVVEVVLGRDVGVDRPQQAAQRVADRRPPGVPQVQRAGRVGRDELQVQALSGKCAAPAVPTAGKDHDARQLPGGGRVETDIEKARSRDLHRLDPRRLGQLVGQRDRQVARRQADLLRHLEGEHRGVVAVLGVARSLHAGRLRQDGHVEAALGQGGARRGQHDSSEFGGSHRPMLPRVDSGTWRRPEVLVTMRDATDPGIDEPDQPP